MNTLTVGDSMKVGQEPHSNDQIYILAMQYDCNLVHYAGTRKVWETGTLALEPFSQPNRLERQADGNCVLTNDANFVAWAAGTDGHPGWRLVVQDDRSLVVLGDAHTVKGLGADHTAMKGSHHATLLPWDDLHLRWFSRRPRRGCRT
jgi:hypothetical protein